MARPGRPERNRAARSFCQLRRFHHVINSDKVFGTHSHSPIIGKELSKFTTAKKIGLIQEALTQDMPESSNAIAEFFGELYSARSERNEIVHNTWRATDTPEVKALVKVKHKGPEEHVRSVTAKGMITLADRLLDLAIELGDWKMASNNAQLRRSASAPLSATSIWPLNAPRTSAKDRAK